MFGKDGIMKIRVTKFQMIIDSSEETVMGVVDSLNKPDYEVTIEKIDKIIITVEKKDPSLSLNTLGENE